MNTVVNENATQTIQHKHIASGPRVTPQRVEDVIASEQYHVFPGTTLTVCALTLVNGYTLTGESACVSMENFDAGLGRSIARERAVQKIWELEGYALRERLAVINGLPGHVG